MIRAAFSLPNEAARAGFGCAGASLGFSLLTVLNSYSVLGLGVVVLVLSGLFAGWRTAWFAVPAGVWLFNAAFVSSDCSPQCGEGRVGPPLDRAILLTLPLIVIAELGALGEMIVHLPQFARRWRVALACVSVAAVTVAASLMAVSRA